MKQHRGKNHHMGGRLRVSHRNNFDRRRRLGERRRNGEPFGDRFGEGVDCSYRSQECHWHAKHLHHDTKAENHHHRHAYLARAAFVETVVAQLKHLPSLYTSLNFGYKNNR